MAPPESSYPIAARPEYPSEAEAQVHNLNTYFMKMIEILKKEIKKNTLKKSKKTQTNKEYWRKSI